MSTPQPSPNTAGQVAPDERRQFERRIFRAPAQLRIPGRDPLAVRAMDISEGGMRILCPINLPNLTEGTLYTAMVLPGGGRKLLEMTVEVRHSVLSSNGDGFQLGVRFLFLNVTTRTAILQYVRG